MCLPVFNSCADILDSLYSTLCRIDIFLFSHFVLVGYFNVDLSTSSHPLSPKLHNIASSFILSQIVTQPTHFSHAGTPSLIDLLFVSSPINVASCQTVPPLSNSDHLGIHLTYKVTHSSRRPRSGPREVWQYSIGDFEKSL